MGLGLGQVFQVWLGLGLRTVRGLGLCRVGLRLGQGLGCCGQCGYGARAMAMAITVSGGTEKQRQGKFCGRFLLSSVCHRSGYYRVARHTRLKPNESLFPCRTVVARLLGPGLG